MEKSAFISATYFTIYSIFLFYQQSLLKNFRGSSAFFLSILTFSVFFGYAAQIIYFIYYGWNVSWIEAVLISLGSIIIGSILGIIMERIFGGLIIVFVGFVAIPYFGYKMFNSIPNVVHTLPQ